MKTYILIYEGFVQFEVVLACYLLKTKGPVITAGLNMEQVESMEGFITSPHTTLSEIQPGKDDMFIIPGGEPEKISDTESFYSFLNDIYNLNCKIGAICSGPVHLAKAGILAGKKFTTTVPVDEFDFFDKSNFIDSNVVVDGNIITAKANGYVDFALDLGREMNIYEDDEDYQETIRFFKNFMDS